MGQRAQGVLARLVANAGGRSTSKRAIGIDDVEILADHFEAWACEHAYAKPEGLYFDGRPGFWHALDELYPLEDPNRWDKLRLAVTGELERRGWKRTSRPRGSGWLIPE